MITDYVIAYGSNASVMADRVRDYLSKGYELYGYVFNDSDGDMCQAMIKREEKDVTVRNDSEV